MNDGAAAITFRPIGVVHTDHHDPGTTPIQGRLNPAGVGRAEIDAAFVGGLEGLDGFDFAWFVTCLHEPAVAAPGDDPLRPVPFLTPDRAPVGVFATRYPVRPNPIGMSLVEIVAIDASTISFRGVDLLDGTPLLDIKPWVPAFDLPSTDGVGAFGDVRTGWCERLRLDAATAPDPARLTPDALDAEP